MGLWKFLSKYDEFGYPISINYTKQEEHKTYCGTSMSMVKSLLLAAYVVHITLVLVIRKDPDIQFSEVYRDFDDEVINAGEIGFDIAFELVTAKFQGSAETWTNAEKSGIDESYFSIKALATTNNMEKGTSNVEVPYYNCLEFESKTGRRPFKYLSDEKFEKKLKDKKCADMENVFFAGTILEG